MKNKNIIVSLIISVLFHAVLLSIMHGNIKYVNNKNSISIYVESSGGVGKSMAIVQKEKEKITNEQAIKSQDIGQIGVEDFHEVGKEIYTNEGLTEVVENTEFINDRFYASYEVDEKPQVIGSLALNFITDESLNEESNIIIDLFINKFGTVVEANLVSSTLSKITAEKILQYFSNVKFTPAFLKGNMVNCVVRIEVKVSD